ncbi:MAG: TlpA family protein disulfide reductase [Proteobacteria bacterium]|jgi:thiol-disulfide isomerase/thioredoxin|nr:TlpA family protein disulfide reductase [Pseudomonadota bacterium]
MLIPATKQSRIRGRGLFQIVLALGFVIIVAAAVDRVAIKAADEPDLVHGFELIDMDGQTRHSDEWEGKPLLINFWATWCIPCRKEMPALMEIHEKFADQGFEVIGIAADEGEKIAKFLEETPVAYPILYGEMTSIFDLSENYGNVIGVLPHTAFVDREGVIRHVKVGEISHEEAEEMVLDIL